MVSLLNRLQQGFTLVEVLVSLLIFSIGILGSISLLTKGIQTNIDNNARAVSIQTMESALEPLYLATTGASLKAAINTFDTNGDAVFNDIIVTNNGGKDSFTIEIVEALDNANTNVLTALPPYVSPIRVAVRALYTGKAGTIQTQGHYTFVVSP